jgi:hypothetical protein
MEMGRGSKIVAGNKNKKGAVKSKGWSSVEYLAVGYKVVATFISIFRVCKTKNIQWQDTISINNNSRYKYKIYNWVFAQKQKMLVCVKGVVPCGNY